MLSRSSDFESVKSKFPIELNEKENELLSHDFETFQKLLTFLNSNSLHTFILHGFMGCGKSTMINLLPKFVDPSVLIFRVNCFESTNLDDVLLSIHTDFVAYRSERHIFLPKIESSVFADRINAYIKSGTSPMLFIFDSVEPELYPLHEDIMNFIKHISQIDKIKVVITSRNVSDKALAADSSANFAIIKLYGQEEFIKLLNKNGLEATDEIYEKVFTASKGHFLYISLLINVAKLLNLSLNSLHNDYSKKKMIIFDFLISKVLTLIPERFFKTLWFLSLIRTGVSENFLITQQLSTKDELAYLEERMLLCREGNNIYLKDYVKDTVKTTLNAQTTYDIHNYLHDLYESQLPKKPAERDLTISRGTMRRESSYHKSAAENIAIPSSNPAQSTSKTKDYNYVGYSKNSQKEWEFSESSIPKRTIKAAPRGFETRVKNNLRAKNFELSNEEINILNKLNLKIPNTENIRTDLNEPNYDNKQNDIQQYMRPALSRLQRRSSLNNNLSSIPDRPEEKTLADVLNEASLAEQEFNFEKALTIYNKAYNMTASADYAEAKPIIVMQTAFCHRKMQNTDEALRFFEIAYKLYNGTNIQKANTALFNMAEIYSEIYNHQQAKKTYELILQNKDNSNLVFNTRVLLNIAEIETTDSNIEKANEYYTEALKISTEIDDKKLISETYFKYGLMYDDAGSVDKAFKMYVKCVQTSNDYEVNTFVSSAYANIAGIYEEQNLPDKAAKYYEEAIKTDEKYDNWDGLYFANSKLALLYQSKSITIATDFSLKALNAAKHLNDSVLTASTYIQIGDYYYQSNLNEEALKSYFLAKELLLTQSNPDNIRKIDIRINDMKNRLGNNLFNKISMELQNNK